MNVKAVAIEAVSPCPKLSRKLQGKPACCGSTEVRDEASGCYWSRPGPPVLALLHVDLPGIHRHCWPKSRLMQWCLRCGTAKHPSLSEAVQRVHVAPWGLLLEPMEVSTRAAEERLSVTDGQHALVGTHGPWPSPCCKQTTDTVGQQNREIGRASCRERV